MDLHKYLLELIAPTAPGDELIPGVRFAGTSTELGLRYRFDADGHRLWVEVGLVERMRSHAAAANRIGFGYRTEGGRSVIAERFGYAVCQALAERASTNEARVLERLATTSTAEADPGARIRAVRVTTALEPSGLDGAYFYTVNPYVGCVIGCRFCYAQRPLESVRTMLGLEPFEWGSYVEVRANLPELLSAELATMPVLPIKVSPIVSDAYHGVEKAQRVTRRCLEAVAASDRGWPALILTRSQLVLRDLDVLARIEGAWVGVSMPTFDDEVRRHFEPRAASVEERLRVLDDARAAGVRTFVVIQPMMAGPIDDFADALAGRVQGVVLDLLAEEEGAVADFDDPRYATTRHRAWQLERGLAMRDALALRGVPVWRQELPPEYCAPDGGAGRPAPA